MMAAPSAAAKQTATPVAATQPPPNFATVERRCDNPDCDVVRLVSMVPKRKTAQFVTEPKVMEKPMLINGFTTIFQLDGVSAKLSDIKAPNNSHPPQKPMYRIVPNTHAHIVNYVVVDSDGESLRKINENDPGTMQKLLESQRVSAEQMLKKLMAGHGVGTAGVSVAPTVTSTPTPIAAPTTTTTKVVRTIRTASTGTPAGPAKKLSTSSAAAAPTAAKTLPTAPKTSATPPHIRTLKNSMHLHPNLKITSVVSADNVSGASKPSTPQTATSPVITPVPLATLQSSTGSTAARGVAASPAPVDTVEKPVFDKMQAELQELRRTVALLAEAQAKQQHSKKPNEPNPSTPPQHPQRATKRARLN